MGGKKRYETSSDGLRKVCMKKVRFADNHEVIENQPAEPEANAPAPETSTATSARKRGRPKLAPEDISPLEQQEKRMKTAKEKFYEERFDLATKIIELHSRRAFDDHPSTVARLRQRLDARAERVVELQMDAERAEAEWELGRRVEAVERSAERKREREIEARDFWALLENLGEAHKDIGELHQQLESMQAAMHEARQEVHKVKLEAAEAKVAAAREAAKKAREREL